MTDKPENQFSNEKPSLTARTGKAARWQFTSVVVQSLLQFIVGIVLARLLPPEDFGLIALAMIVIGFTQMFADLGFGPAVIQRRNLQKTHIRVSFTTSVLLGVCLSVLIYFIAPYALWVFDDLDLPSVLRVIGLTFFINGFGTTARAMLRRELRFKGLFKIDFLGQIASFPVSIFMAYNGFGVWSLVAGTLIANIITTTTTIGVVRHSFKPMLRYKELKELFSFGFGVSLNRVVNYSATNGDSFIIGNILGVAALGLYNKAYNLMNLPLHFISRVLSSVLFPAFSEIQDDIDKIRSAYLQTTKLVSMIAAPVMIGMAIAAPHLIIGLYGDKWSGAIVPLQILAGAGYFRALYHIGGSLAHATKNVYKELFRQIGYAILIITGAWLGSSAGINGIALGVSFAIVYMYAAMAHLSLQISQISWWKYLRVQCTGIYLTVIVGSGAFLIRLITIYLNLSDITIFSVLFISCVSLMIGGLYTMPRSQQTKQLLMKIHQFSEALPKSAHSFIKHILWI